MLRPRGPPDFTSVTSCEFKTETFEIFQNNTFETADNSHSKTISFEQIQTSKCLLASLNSIISAWTDDAALATSYTLKHAIS